MKVIRVSMLPVKGLRITRGHDQDVLVISMAPVETSTVQSFFTFFPLRSSHLKSFVCKVQMECLKFLRE